MGSQVPAGALVCWLTAQLAACTTWRLEQVAPADLIARDHPSRVRIDATDGSRQVFYRPEVRGDSLWGRKREAAAKADRVVALRDVTGVATRHTSAGKSALLVLGIGATAVGALVLTFTLGSGGLGE